MAFITNEIQGTASRGISQRSYTRLWRVRSDSVVLHPALAIPQVPAIEGAAFPYDTLAICKQLTADYEDINASREVILVTATYETGGGGDEQVEDENPINDRPDIRWDERTVRLPVRVDIDGKPIQNSAGQPFDPLPEEDFRIVVYEYSHNVISMSPTRTNDYRGAINSDNLVIGGLPVEPFQARMARIQHQNAERNGVRYWRESIVVEIVDDHRLTLVDEGIMKKSGVAGGPGDPHYIGGGEFKVIPMLDDFGNPIFEPTLLDGNGEPLGGGNPVLLRFDTAAKPLKAFGPLGLPTTNTP